MDEGWWREVGGGVRSLPTQWLVFFGKVCCRNWNSALKEICRLFIGSALPSEPRKGEPLRSGVSKVLQGTAAPPHHGHEGDGKDPGTDLVAGSTDAGGSRHPRGSPGRAEAPGPRSQAPGATHTQNNGRKGRRLLLDARGLSQAALMAGQGGTRRGRPARGGMRKSGERRTLTALSPRMSSFFISSVTGMSCRQDKGHAGRRALARRGPRGADLGSDLLSRLQPRSTLGGGSSHPRRGCGGG